MEAMAATAPAPPLEALLALALDPATEVPSDPTSERILDAALAAAAASGTRNVTMGEVARKAGVGRVTVYRRFEDKAHLIEALGVRECRRCLGELNASIPSGAALEEQIAEGFVASIRIARRHPLLNRLARVEPEVILEGLTARNGYIFGLLRSVAAARLRIEDASASGSIDIDQAAEILVRLALSFVLIQPSGLPLDDEEATRELARQIIAPIVAGGPDDSR